MQRELARYIPDTYFPIRLPYRMQGHFVTARTVALSLRWILTGSDCLLGCRNRAYVARGYSQPPSIENFATHPFFQEMEAKEVGSSAASGEATQSAAVQGAKPAASAAKALQSSAATPAAASAPAPPAQLFDLLSLHDVSSVPPDLPCTCLLSLHHQFGGNPCAVGVHPKNEAAAFYQRH